MQASACMWGGTPWMTDPLGPDFASQVQKQMLLNQEQRLKRKEEDLAAREQLLLDNEAALQVQLSGATPWKTSDRPRWAIH